MLLSRNKKKSPIIFEASLPSSFMHTQPGYMDGYNPTNDEDNRYTDNLYYPRKRELSLADDGIGRYWLANKHVENSAMLLTVECGSEIVETLFDQTDCGIRPVISISREDYEDCVLGDTPGGVVFD